MEKVSEFLGLSKQAISIYNACLGKGLLTYGEVKSLTPDVDDNALIEILNNLITKKLLIQFVPEHMINLVHYLAILPFSIIMAGTNQIKNFFTDKDINLVENIENNIKSIFSEGQKIGINQISKNFQAFEKELKDGALKVQKEVEKLKDNQDKIDNPLDFLLKYEEELKKIIESELAGILIILLQLKVELSEKLHEAGINDNQWSLIKNSIKEIMTLKVHDKVLEVNNIISDEFKEINNLLIDKVKPSDLIELELKSTNLEILKYVQNKVNKIQNEIQTKNKNIKDKLEKLETNIYSSVIEVIQIISKHILKNIEFIEEFLQIILNQYSEINQFSLENFWPIRNNIKIQEQISNVLEKSKENVTLIVPNLPDYIPIEKLSNSPENLKIKIISSESHNSELVKNLIKSNNIEYNKLKNRDLIGIISDDNSFIIGVKDKSQSDPLKDIVGFGTNYKPLIDVIYPVFSEKLLSAKPKKETQITNQFNMIIENINDFKGSKISRILQGILDVAVKMEGISLNVLDIKLLISKLKSIEKPLNDEMKQGVIDKIIILNPIFSKLELIPTPKFRAPRLKKIMPKAKREPDQAEVTFKKRELSDIERLNASFEIFLENIDEFKGVELANHIETIIDLTLTSQGFPEIVEWRHGLKLIEAKLEDAFKEKLRGDVDKWHNDLLSIKEKVDTPKEAKVAQIETEKTKSSAPSLSQLKAKKQPQIETDFTPSSVNVEQEDEAIANEGSEAGGDSDLKGSFDSLIQDVDNLKGVELNKKLINIADIILETQGYSMALKEIREWSKKLSTKRALLEEEMKIEFKQDLEAWKNKFS